MLRQLRADSKGTGSIVTGRKLLGILTGLGALAAGLAPLQAGADTLMDGLRSAYRTNPTLQAERDDLKAQNEEYVQARAALGPTVDASVGTTDASSLVQEKTIIDTTYKVHFDHISSSTSELSLSQVLYSSGHITAQINAAQADILSSRQQLRLTEATVLFEVIQAHEDVRRDLEIVNISRQSVKQLQDEVDAIQQKYDAGAANTTDLSQVKARLAAAQVQLTNAESQLEDSRGAFLQVVGLSPGTLDEPNLPSTGRTLAESITAAEKNSPELLAAVYTEKADRARLQAAKAQRGPTVTADARVERDPQDLYNPLFQQSSSVGVTVRWHLFSSGLTSSAIRQAEDADKEAKDKIDAANRSVRYNIKQYWDQFSAANSSRSLMEDQVKQEKLAFDSSQQQYTAGLISTIDLLNAQQETQTAEVSLARAAHDQYVAQAELLREMGVLEASLLLPGEPDRDAVKPADPLVLAAMSPWFQIVQTLDGLGQPDTKP